MLSIIKMSFNINTSENLKNLNPESIAPQGFIWQLRAHTGQEKSQYRERKSSVQDLQTYKSPTPTHLQSFQHWPPCHIHAAVGSQSLVSDML